jgi:hypothetical protein
VEGHAQHAKYSHASKLGAKQKQKSQKCKVIHQHLQAAAVTSKHKNQQRKAVAFTSKYIAAQYQTISQYNSYGDLPLFKTAHIYDIKQLTYSTE